MSGRVHAEVKSAPKSSFGPVRSGLLAGYHEKQLVSQPPLIQAKLTINQPNDRYEQEADRVADEVMRMPEPRLQPQVEADEEKKEPIQAKESSGQTPHVSPIVQTQIHSLRGGGQRLSPSLRNFFEPRFGHDFSQVQAHSDAPRLAQADLAVGAADDRYEQEADRVADKVLRQALLINSDESRTARKYDFSQVRIHTGMQAAESAKAINSHAYTFGNNIVFGERKYSPETNAGKYLLGHELTHVIQQRSLSSNFRLIQRFNEHGQAVDPEPIVGEAEHGETPGQGETSPSQRLFETPNVQRVFVYREEMQVAFITEDGVINYELQQCDVEPGEYIATVEVSGDNVMLWYGGTEGGDITTASFHYLIRPWQPNPASLLRGQQRVLLYVRQRRSSEIEAQEPRRPECWYEIPSVRVINERSINDETLIGPTHFERELWSEPIEVDLGDWGTILITATGAIDYSGTISGSVGPGDLVDICLSQAEHGRGHSRRAVRGGAEFHCPADIRVSIPIQATLTFRGNYGGAINLVTIEANVGGDFEAADRFDFNAELEVIWDPDPESEDHWTFRIPVDITTMLSFALNANAGIALELLNRRIWSASWEDRVAYYEWRGGVRIAEDLSSIEIIQGQIEERQPTPETPPSRPTSSNETILNILRSVLNPNISSMSMHAAPPSLIALPAWQRDDRFRTVGAGDERLREMARTARIRETDLSLNSFFRNYAAVRYEDDQTNSTHYEGAFNEGGGGMHSEPRVIGRLGSLHNKTVLELYSERKPCGECHWFLQENVRRPQLRRHSGNPEKDMLVGFTIPLSNLDEESATRLRFAWGAGVLS